ncbi:MAG TPA: adenylate/guanylate cyclase domain-containing protein, partial [Caldimonas sp.]
MDEPLPQRLAAVLAADAVGFSKSMAEDDQGTVTALDDARAVFRDRVLHCKGRVVDTAGDSVLCVFDSAANAVRAALQIQEHLRARSRSGRLLEFRIGLHLGDVIFKEDGSIYGDGVNVAARLQSLAPAGQVLVSEAVRGTLRSDMAATLVDLGVHQVKNIGMPIQAYLLPSTRRAAERPETSGTLTAATDAFSVARPVQGFGGRPAIAVLPFDNMSSDPDQAFIADGIAEDILTRLALWRYMPVIARNSSFAFRGRARDLKEVGAALGARYILEGSVRKSASRIRITGQLIDAETGHHVWAAKYDRMLKDLFDLQDEISGEIVSALEAAVGAAERSRAHRRPAHDLGAWELYQRGCSEFARLTGTDLAEAKRLCLAAAQRDATFGLPLGLAAFSNHVAALFGWTDPAVALREAVELASEAMSRDALDPGVLGFHGTVCAFAGRLDAAASSCRSALQLNPSSALAHLGLAYACLLSGDFETGTVSAETALRLSPNDFLMPLMLGVLSASHYLS